MCVCIKYIYIYMSVYYVYNIRIIMYVRAHMMIYNIVYALNGRHCPLVTLVLVIIFSLPPTSPSHPFELTYPFR